MQRTGLSLVFGAQSGFVDGVLAHPELQKLGAWEAISTGRHALVIAPTGWGKTLAAFLWSFDRLASEPLPDDLVALIDRDAARRGVPAPS